MGRLELRHVILPRLEVLLQLRERHHLRVDEVSDLLKEGEADKLEEADLRFGDVLVVYAVAKRRYRNTADAGPSPGPRPPQAAPWEPQKVRTERKPPQKENSDHMTAR